MSKFPDASPLVSTTSLPALDQLHLSKTPGPPPCRPKTPKSFPFFLLPPELRSRILFFLLCPTSHFTIDLSDENHRTSTPRLNYFLASKRFGYEAYHVFYSSHTFRVFQTHYRFLGKRTLPLLARLPRHYLNAITKLELRLGPGWHDPPKPWVVNERLGLESCENVRTLKIFVEVDPSSPIFKGFRLDCDFYTDFCGTLLRQIMERLPLLDTIEYDAYSSVDRNGALMIRLLEESKKGRKKITWGKERNWGDSLADKLEMARDRARARANQQP
ncbi:MAG: hypothetical protein Q9168_008376 [Polycauliona sp. 1 TL-2023]